MGKLIVIEGLDGGGKSTQTKLLEEKLGSMGEAFTHVKFPDYNSPSSALVKMYLAGEFGDAAAAGNAYAVGTFYAVDRYASYEMHWKKDYESGKLIIADRYTTANLIYQLGKLPEERWEEYIAWVEDFEYGKLMLPKPDLILFLDMPIDVSQRLLSERYAGDESKKDIHEADVAFLKRSYKSALFSAKKQGWKIISCAESGSPRSIEDIHADIIRAIDN